MPQIWKSHFVLYFASVSSKSMLPTAALFGGDERWTNFFFFKFVFDGEGGGKKLAHFTFVYLYSCVNVDRWIKKALVEGIRGAKLWNTVWIWAKRFQGKCSLIGRRKWCENSLEFCSGIPIFDIHGLEENLNFFMTQNTSSRSEWKLLQLFASVAHVD